MDIGQYIRVKVIRGQSHGSRLIFGHVITCNKQIQLTLNPSILLSHEPQDYCDMIPPPDLILTQAECSLKNLQHIARLTQTSIVSGKVDPKHQLGLCKSISVIHGNKLLIEGTEPILGCTILLFSYNKELKPITRKIIKIAKSLIQQRSLLKTLDLKTAESVNPLFLSAL